jgi:sulfite reductase (NADPH) hemoprotein beta-component
MRNEELAAPPGAPEVRPEQEATARPPLAARRRRGFAEAADVDRFLATLGRFERGEISAEAWRAFTRLQGIYGQRQDGFAMLRAKIPQGVLDAPQLRALALVAELFSRGFGHFTTRQDFQFHFVRPVDLEAAIRVLAAAGITTREGCGNSVRNVTACPLSGVGRDEVFDVTPYAEATTRYLLRHPLSSSLPRKFKIAFESCREDHALTAIHDLGLRARLQEEDGRIARGFHVVAGGGTGTVPTSARTLVEFLPAGDLLALLEAVVSVFHRLGDRQNRHASRLKFLIRKMGHEAFRAEVEREMAAALRRRAPVLPFDPERALEEGPPSWTRPESRAEAVSARARVTRLRGPGLLQEGSRSALFRRSGGGPGRSGAAALGWLATNVHRQRQPGFAAATVTLPLGDITAEQLRVLADLARAYGDGTVRATVSQNLVLRWVPEGEVLELYRRLAAAGLGGDGSGTAVDVVSCPGAETCPQAVTGSRGVARLVEEHLRSRPDLVAAGRDLTIKVSGCPSGCSQHHVAGIGLQGSARKVGGRPVPQYFLFLGGGGTADGARFGTLAAKIPARRVPEAVQRLITLYDAERAPEERAADFFARVPLERARALLRDLGELTPASALAEDFVDPGDDAADGEQPLSGQYAA